jgi:hypothetical protein
MDLASARSAGIDFFTHKATEGVSTKHTHYGEALSRARSAGVPFVGAYHVVRSGPSIAAQVDYLLAYVNTATPWWRDHPGWFFQCDLEKWPYDAVPAQRGADFCVALAQRTGKAVLLYAPRWAYGDAIGGQAPLLASNYVAGAGGFKALYPGDSSSRWAAYSGRTPAILQFSSTATIGRQSGCDANAFRGSVADFAGLIGASTPGGSPMPQDYTGYGVPKEIGNRPDSVVIADLSGQEMIEASYWDHTTQSARTRRLVRTETKVDQLLAAAAADEQRDKAALAAIQGLTALIQQAGGDVSAAPILAAVQAVGDDTHTAVAALQQQLANAHTELVALRAEVDAVKAAAQAQLSPAERASVQMG